MFVDKFVEKFSMALRRVLCCAGFCRAAAGGANESDPDRPRHHRLPAAEEAQVGGSSTEPSSRLPTVSSAERTREAEPDSLRCVAAAVI